MASKEDVPRVMEDARQRWGRVRLNVSLVARIRRVSAAELASAMGMSRSTVQARLAGTSQIQPWEADGFASVLGVEREVLEYEEADLLRWLGEHPGAVSRISYFAAERQVSGAVA